MTALTAGIPEMPGRGEMPLLPPGGIVELLYQQSKLKDAPEKENFDTLSYDFF